MGRLHLTIHRKLIGLMVVMMAAIVGFLTYYFPEKQIDGIEGAMATRAATYGEMLSVQARSAVAFNDRETAREVLTSVASDPSVVTVYLYDQAGVALYAKGEASDWFERARRGVLEVRTFRWGERVATVWPVQSLEGPRGTLIVELSTEEVRAAAHRVRMTAIAIGALALSFGALAAWLIACSLARRLEAIGSAASRIAAGARHETVEDKSSDEIGTLASAFNAMTRQLRAEEDALAKANHELEDRVAARTEQLVSEMASGARMEIELRQAQKLESVGRLAAGIAHEINTPVQYVSDSCHFLRTASLEMAVVVEGYRGLVAPEAHERMREMEDDNDLEFLLEEMPKAAGRSLEGLERVAAIVRSMKEFAYPERNESTLADLNAAIENTLTISRNEYKYIADVKTELGALPPVLCHVGEINQAVLNMVINAAHAIEDVVRGTDRRGEIVIHTEVAGSDVLISIRDTGKGIPTEILDRIFDPFFTTKEVGKGTGQGLAIARSIVVDKHGGKLSVESQVGVGTAFTIRLPVGGFDGRPAAG